MLSPRKESEIPMGKSELKEYLLSKESPFNWNVPTGDHAIEEQITQLVEKFENIEEESSFQWTRFIVSLSLSYQIFERMNDPAKAQEHIIWCREHLASLKQADCQEPLFRSVLPVLLHVTTVTHAVILLASGQINKARTKAIVLSNSRHNIANIAGLQGVKAAMYLQCGYKGHRMALEAAREARDLDPDQAEWWFIIGNALGRIRRNENGTITTEETEAIERAFLLQKDASYTVHLAQHYSELSKFWHVNGNCVKAKSFTFKAAERYREAINLRPNCASLKARVAHGMLRISCKGAQDIPFAKKLLDDLKEKMPNNGMVYHDLGFYYQKFERNYKEALLNLQRSNELGNPKALLHLATIKWKIGLESQIIQDLEEGLTRYKGKENQAQLLACLGVCHALINDDWNSAITTLKMSLEVDPSGNSLEKFQNISWERINLLEMVTNHLYFNATNANQNLIQSFLDFLHELKPQYIQPKEAMKASFQAWKIKLLISKVK